ILRPIACSDDAAVGLAVILKGPRTPPGGLILKNAPGNPSVKSDLNKAEANKIPPLNGEPDVLEAFLQYLKKEQN
ncbi:MAG: type III-B CRISPR module RAMP protein Cmr1, partial [Chloroflexota bacterium]|nr:type III-B CRISPR module RAMP protein Cmr1 [Chloroflexota bacterium]